MPGSNTWMIPVRKLIKGIFYINKINMGGFEPPTRGFSVLCINFNKYYIDKILI